MSEEKDPFEEYYEESSNQSKKGETASEILASLEKLAEQKEKDKKVAEDAKRIREPINIFIKKMNALIGDLCNAEQSKKTPPALIVTLLVGGLAFTVANVYYLLTRNMGVKMTAEEYEKTFLGMFQSAINNIGKNEK